MKKKIIIGSIFAVLILILTPAISTVNAQKQDECILSTPSISAYEDEDNSGGWVTNTMNYVTNIYYDLMYIASSRGIVKDIFTTLTDIFNLIKSLRACEKFVDLIDVIINQFIPTVQETITVVQNLIGLVNTVVDLIAQTQEFVTYIQGEPWTAPVLIRGIVSSADGPIEAHVTSTGESYDTDSTGYYYFELESLQEYLPSTYDVTASAEGFTEEEQSTGLLFPDGIITVDFELGEDDDDDESASRAKSFLFQFFELRNFYFLSSFLLLLKR